MIYLDNIPLEIILLIVAGIFIIAWHFGRRIK